MNGIVVDNTLYSSFTESKIRIYNSSTIGSRRQHIGRGTFGNISRILLNDTLVAIKDFNKVSFSNGNDRRLACSLQLRVNLPEHPNVLKIDGVVINDGFLVSTIFPLMDNGDLYKAISNPKIRYSINCIYGWAMQMCSGLAFLHSQNIVHRDIKPHNMVLTETYSVLKLCDLDGARKVIPDEMMTNCVGTTDFFAPETNSGMYDVKADMPGIGVTLWMLSTRESPKDFKLEINNRPDINLINNPFIKKTAQMCWTENAKSRPSAEDVAKKYSALFKKDSGYDIEGDLCDYRTMDLGEFSDSGSDWETVVRLGIDDSNANMNSSTPMAASPKRGAAKILIKIFAPCYQRRIPRSVFVKFLGALTASGLLLLTALVIILNGHRESDTDILDKFAYHWVRTNRITFNGTQETHNGADRFPISFKLISPTALLYEYGDAGDSSIWDFKDKTFKILPPNKIVQDQPGILHQEFWIDKDVLHEYFEDESGDGFRCEYEKSSVQPITTTFDDEKSESYPYSKELIGKWKLIKRKRYDTEHEWEDDPVPPEKTVVSFTPGKEPDTLVYSWPQHTEEWKLNSGPENINGVDVVVTSSVKNGIQKNATWLGGGMTQRFFLKDHKLQEVYEEEGTGWKCQFEKI